MRRFVVPAIAAALLAVAVAAAGIGSGRQSAPAEARGLDALTSMQQRLLSGFACSAL
jgi:hypothetical protein